MKPRLLILPISWTLLLPLLSFCTSTTEDSSSSAKADDSASLSAAPLALATTPVRIPVRVSPLVLQDVEEILELTGTARPWDEFEVSSEIPGRVTQIRAEEGHWVEKGQLLVELDRDRRLIELQSRKAELARTQVILEFAGKRRERGKALLQRGAVSQSEVDSLDQEVRVAQASVRLSEISIRSLEDEIDDTRIYSPADGQISRRSISLGETVSPSSPLFLIIQVHPMKVVTEIGEPYLHKIRPTDPVRVVFDSISGSGLQGQIHFVHPVANPVSGAFPTEIRLRNPSRLIQPGMVARVEIKANLIPSASVAPLDAVLDLEDRQFVFVVSDGQVHRREVRLLKRVGSLAVLEGPIQPGDLLVSSGTANLTDGTFVEVIS